MRRRAGIVAGITLIFAIALFFLYNTFYIGKFNPPTSGGKREVNITTDTVSSKFSSDTEKIAFLKQYMKLRSEIEAAEFHIVYRDNSTGFPGPSDWDMRIVMKMSPKDLPRWIEGKRRVDGQKVDLSWSFALLPKVSKWRITSQPAFYKGNGVEIAVFASEGILFERIRTY